MAGLSIVDACKRYGAKTVLSDVTLAAEDGAFLALLGPSGCGKSTLLRLIAGFERLDGGQIDIGGAPMSGPGIHVPTEARRLGMVFQSYALWPHMSVAENVGFALQVRGVPAASRRAQVGAALETVDLSGFADRRPAQLSGGQRQRVALARVLAARPQVVLLDEPLANLDAHLREVMQDEFRRFHAEAGATMVFVTHDQAEALALADRVAVMMDGALRQVDTPRKLYDCPADSDVARFLGRGAVVPVQVLDAVGGRATVALGDARMQVRAGAQAGPGPGAVSVRPDGCKIAAPGQGVPATVRHVRYTGPSNLVTVTLAASPDTDLLATASPGQQIAPGDAVAVDIADAWLLPTDA